MFTQCDIMWLVIFMNEFKDMLIFLRKREGLSQLELGEKLNLTKSTISMYENGRRKPSFEVLEAIADYFNVSMNFLMGKDDAPAPIPANVIPLPKMKRVPLIGTIACGTPTLAVEDATEFIDAPEGIQNDIDFALECKGDSMINARIFPGDIVYIKQQPVVENGEIAAVLIGDEATLKRVYYTPGNDRITLQACNPLYSDMIYTGEQLNEIKILGKAVWFMSRVRI